MIKQTILWTALPNGSDGLLAEGTKLKLSVFAAPRLWNSDPTVTAMQLNSFPDFLDWPAAVNAASFQVEFGGGPSLPATRTSALASSEIWTALFKPDTLVRPFAFEDLSGKSILSFPSAEIHDIVKGVYQRAAIDPTYGGGLSLPGRGIWQNDPDLGEIARPTRPAEPYHPAETDRGPVKLDEPYEEEPPTEEPPGGEPPGGEPPGEERPWWQSCLFFFIGLIERILKALGIISTLPLMMIMMPPLYFKPNGGGGGGPAVASAKKAAFDQLTEYLQPASTVSKPLPQQPADVADQYDFHAVVSSMGDYPALLRLLGLVVDLEVTLPAALPAATSTVRVVPNVALTTATTNSTERTRYNLADNSFVAQPRPSSPEINHGLLRLNDPTKFRVIQTDVPSAGLKLQNMATNMLALDHAVPAPPNRPEEEGLPALQTTGISIVRPEIQPFLKAKFYTSYALNSAVAALDGFPILPIKGPDPAPPPTDELYAEDVTRGYRIDVWDDKSNLWHSVCQRIGTYTFLDLADPPLVLEDEGFVQMGVTEQIGAAESDPIRAQDSLFIWDGWSLAAPRPGQTILPDHTTGDPANTAVTPFKMETSFRAKPNTLPRLRIGYSYKLRVRAVDLAGNSVFQPGDPEFATDQPEITALIKYRRCEPVSPPPLLLRAEPKEGESLEQLVVRSQHDSLTGELETERHIVPPKISQAMAELHSKFDLAGGMRKDAAGYDLASREAGSLTHFVDLATGTLQPIPGVQEITTPEHTYWLQTNQSFDLSYLPDPYARGVLLLGLPGMASFDEIIEPGGLIVNKIPFEGAWPDPKPIRLQVTGILKDQAPAQPAWDALNRVLTVELPQGESAVVWISSYFLPADLENKAVWGWVEEAAPANLNQLRDQAAAGRNWLHLPFRKLTLVHAVQRPLDIPTINTLEPRESALVIRTIGDTRATLQGSLLVDAKSTSKVDLRAAWQDPNDDPAKPAYDETTDFTSAEMQVGAVQVEDPGLDQVDFEGLIHAVGDTKYHQVTYAATATTRFREYFPTAVTADPQNLVRPTAAELGTPPAAVALKVVDIPNNARPSAPKPIYVVPTFQWSEATAGDVTTHIRRGGGLRVYMERPWFSSGAGELLGALVRPSSVHPTSEQGEILKKYTTEWGMDPIWNAEETAPLRLSDFVDVFQSKPNLSLAEIASGVVHVAGYKPGYDTSRNLWYCDITVDPTTAYYPFIRLALARFQPNSVKDAHLSTVVQTDFCQVVPHRTVEYDLSQLSAANQFHVKVSGPAYFQRQFERLGSPFFFAGVLKQTHPGIDDELNWEVLPGVTGNNLQPTQQDTAETIWEGDFVLPPAAPRPLRILLLEAEVFWNELNDQDRSGMTATLMSHARTAAGRTSDLPGGAVILPTLPKGVRMVFADELILP